MKKILLIIIALFSFNMMVSADEIVTYPRSESDLRVNKKYDINTYNMQKVLNTPSVDAELKVYDFASIINTDYTEQIKKFKEKYKMEMVILTVQDQKSRTAEQYGQDFYDYNDFGIEYENYSGILLIIDLDTSANGGQRRVEMVTTGDAILLFNDARIERILDDMMPALQNSNYDEAAQAFIQKTEFYANEGVPKENEGIYIDKDGNFVKPFKPFYFADTLIAGLLTALIMMMLINRNKMVSKTHSGRQYSNDKEKVINIKKDTFVHTHTVSHVIQRNTGSSGGGSIGGSSFGGGSSGGSHGGGGRSF